MVEKPSSTDPARTLRNAAPMHANPVDARVTVEALVLDEDERVTNDFRDVAELDERSPLEAQLGDEASVDGVDLRRLSRRVRVEDLNRRAASIATDESPARVRESAAERDAERHREQDGPDERWIARR